MALWPVESGRTLPPDSRSSPYVALLPMEPGRLAGRPVWANLLEMLEIASYLSKLKRVALRHPRGVAGRQLYYEKALSGSGKHGPYCMLLNRSGHSSLRRCLPFWNGNHERQPKAKVGSQENNRNCNCPRREWGARRQRYAS